MQIEKVSNPFEEMYEGYHCFGCCKRNEKGLKLDFFRYKEYAFGRWEPDLDLQGYHNIMHGGIQATMLDEISAWWVYIIVGTAGFTARLSIRYHKHAPVNRGALFLRAGAMEKRRNLYNIKAELFGGNGDRYASGDVEFFTYPADVAERDMQYPGHSRFLGTLVESSDYGFPEAMFEALA